MTATAAEKFEACSAMLKETMAQYSPVKPALFAKTQRDPKQAALYASACGLAEAAVAFAVESEGLDLDAEKAREHATNPRWIAEQSRESLAQLFCTHASA